MRVCVCVYHARHHLEWKYSEFFAASLSRGFASEEAYATRYSNRCITCVITWPRLVRTYVLATCVKIHAILSSYTAVQYFSMLWIGARGWKEREREGKGHRELGLEKEVEFNAWYIQFLAIKFANSLWTAFSGYWNLIPWWFHFS